MSTNLKPYQTEFIEFALQVGVLKFGEFTLKSGRVSPYFFNAGLFNTGAALAKLGGYYAAAIADQAPEFDLLFGPAYKGIPIAAATAVALADKHQIDTPYAFNRKEAKDHGEGGTIVGAEMAGRILIIDDVITAGTAIREVMDIIEKFPAQPAAVMVALDRQEKGSGDKSAIQEVEAEYGIPVLSIINLAQLVQFLEENKTTELADPSVVSKINDYREKYGVETA